MIFHALAVGIIPPDIYILNAVCYDMIKEVGIYADTCS